MAYTQENAKVLLELEAMIENLGYGQLDLSFDLHNRRITATTFYGKKRNKYTKNNQQAMQDIADRLVRSVSQGKTEKVTFEVNVRNGNIEQTIWMSQMKKNNEVLTNK